MVISMNIKSLWMDNIERKQSKKLDKDIDVDILIIGAGITGLTTAYYLMNNNLSVCVVDRHLVGSGISSRTTGKITYLQELVYQKIVFYHSKEISSKYLKSQREAIDIVKNIVRENHIDCDLCKVSSYVYTNKENKISKLNKEASFLTKHGIKVIKGSKLPINIPVKYFISIEDSYVFHPLKYLLKLKEICEKNNINIYENTKIIKCKKSGDVYICKTENHKIRAKKVVFACHYPYFTIPFVMPLKTYIEKSYIIATKIEDKLNISGITDDKVNFSFRSHADKSQKYLICLGESHNLRDQGNDEEKFCKLKVQSKNIIKDIDYLWTNHDIITSDFLPYIGKINKKDNLFIATGYNTWGMTNGTIAGKIISDIILDKENEYIDLFNPSRDINIGKIINTPNNIYSNSKAFIKSKIQKNNENIKFEKRNGKNVAIYIDENGNEHIVYNKCPHLKCGLMFNNKEKTWDCPCHGSRFDIDGKCILGPSNYDIVYKEHI